MKVFVTGGAGFLGSHICSYFREIGADVVAYDNFTKHELFRTGYDVTGAREYMRGILRAQGVQIYQADIRDDDTLLSAASGSDFICHCAAQPAMTVAYESPAFDAKVNVIGTLNVLDVARTLKIPVVNCSTIHIYGNGLNDKIREGEKEYWRSGISINEHYPILSGTLSPLHASKRAAEIYTRTYAEAYGVRAASFRLTGMYGPWQFGGEDHGWVANFAIRTLLGLPIKVYHSDKQVRDIIYVSDAVAAFVQWYDAGAPPGIYNICGGNRTETTLGQVLRELAKITGKKQDITVEPGRKGDLLWFVGDWGGAYTRFGWTPKVEVSTGLANLVTWIDTNMDLFKERGLEQ